MHSRKQNGLKGRRRGAVAAQVAVSLTVMLGFTALSVDVGAMYNAKAELQRTADASALAAASMLGEYAEGDPLEAARQAASKYAASNTLFGQPIVLDPQVDVVFGRANYDAVANQYAFTPTTNAPDAVQVTARFTDDSPNGPLPLYFAAILGRRTTQIAAEATAIIVPRDIAIVADLSGSMNDDSELRNVHNHRVNLFDVWAALPKEKGQGGILNGYKPPAPGAPTAGDLQPATGPGLPGHVGGNPNENNEPFADDRDHGPRWGWMTTWGTDLEPDVYDPAADTGLFHIRRNQTTTDPDVIQNLIESGYNEVERAALLTGAYDSNVDIYRARVQVMLGLAGWSSGKSGGKYTVSKQQGMGSSTPGDGDNYVTSAELVQTVDYPFANGSWGQYIDYVKGSSYMTTGDADFQYRYGIKTLANFLLEKKPEHNRTPELAGTPAQPVTAVKEAVAHMAEVIYELNTDDQVSLEIYAETTNHEQDLAARAGPPDYFAAGGRLQQMQAGHYDTWTNMGGGIALGRQELTESGRQRGVSRKIMILLTDGQANVDQYGHVNKYTAGKEYALTEAQAAADMGIRIFCVSHGYDADQDIMDQIAEIGSGEHFHAEGSIEEYGDQLAEIFAQLGGQRPVELIK